MAKKEIKAIKVTKVLIYVSGGNVQVVNSNNPDIQIELFDADNLKGTGMTNDEISRRYEEKLKLLYSL